MAASRRGTWLQPMIEGSPLRMLNKRRGNEQCRMKNAEGSRLGNSAVFFILDSAFFIQAAFFGSLLMKNPGMRNVDRQYLAHAWFDGRRSGREPHSCRGPEAAAGRGRTSR
jgi:hypothetical protein